MIVVDTNILAYLYLPGEKTKLSEQAMKKDPEWVAPVLWRSEFRNILAYYTKNKILKLDNSLKIMREAETLMNGGEYDIASAQVLSLAASSGCSAYDCEFIALALDLKVPLVTSDKKLLKVFRGTALSLEEFNSL
ncbi:MAG: type II toxin-antitoxin system VapC family toxin [Nitrospirota bacterium]